MTILVPLIYLVLFESTLYCGWPAAFVVRTTSSLWELYAASGSAKPGLSLAALRPLLGVPGNLSACPPVGRRNRPTNPGSLGTANLRWVRPLARGGDPKAAAHDTLRSAPPLPGAEPRWWAPQGQLSLHRLMACASNWPQPPNRALPRERGGRGTQVPRERRNRREDLAPGPP